MALGSYDPDNLKAEIYAFGTNAWSTVSDYPFAIGTYVYDYSMIFIPETASYLVIGGKSLNNIILSQLAIFANGTWFDAGQLNSGRRVRFRSL